MAFEILGAAASLLILCVSAKRQKDNFNVGPRIFAANLMLANLILGVISFLYSYGQVNPAFNEFTYSLGGL